ncbi:membrane protein required for colicin V production [Defluviimonas denitrificans]|jgi:membrane protein required for colicin V production|uniref:Membrane protein required for colicin V production n=1 Tax=Albidovulum denitrificans TaxID=404881 RepID=A0A2S8SAA1_9RHOB|nr:CvpA family protein [Defluviimonas denitrificans]PQV57638.1 membrane protein required for colicin V production [Defluviimonas denitrificans]
MEGFTIVDAVVAVVILLSAILAYSRGVVREILAIAGWVAAAVLAFIFAPQAEPLIKQIPVLDTFLGGSCELSVIAAFAAVFAVALIVMSIFTPLFSSAVQRSALGGVDQGLGFLFGVLRGILLVAVAFVAYDRAMSGAGIPVVDNSQSAKVFASLQDRLNAEVPADAPGWITARYQDLIGKCGAPVQSTTDQGTGAKTIVPDAPAN